MRSVRYEAQDRVRSQVERRVQDQVRGWMREQVWNQIPWGPVLNRVRKEVDHHA